MYTQNLHYIHAPIPFPHILPLPLVLPPHRQDEVSLKRMSKKLFKVVNVCNPRILKAKAGGL
jgi:hypothetical protein